MAPSENMPLENFQVKSQLKILLIRKDMESKMKKKKAKRKNEIS